MAIIFGPETEVTPGRGNLYTNTETVALARGGWVTVGIVAIPIKTVDGFDSTRNDIFVRAFGADGAPLFDERHVGVDSKSLFSGSVAIVTPLVDGGWVVAWKANNDIGNTFDDIYQQVYNADGSVRIDEARVNTGLPDFQGDVIVQGLSTGGWVVAFRTEAFRATSDLLLRVYDAAGTALGGDIPVNAVAGRIEKDQWIQPLDNGRFVILWEDFGASAIQLNQQVFDSSGRKIGGQTRVASGENNFSPDIDILKDGSFLVGWSEPTRGTLLQRFDANGTAVGGVIQVSTDSTRINGSPDTAVLDDGGWVTAWNILTGRDFDSDIVQQVFNADGTKRGLEQRVHVNTIGQQGDADVVAIKGGGWAVVWREFIVGGTPSDLKIQIFNADGSREGDLRTVNVTTAGRQDKFQLVKLDNGFLVTWDSNEPAATGFETLVMRQRTFLLPATPPEGKDKTLTVLEDNDYTFSSADFGFSDSDGDSFAAVVVTTLPQNGLMTLDGTIVSAGQVIPVAVLGRLTWKPAQDAFGSGLGAFTFQVVDDGATDAALNRDGSPNRIAFDVIPVNDPPAGQNRTVTLQEDTPHTFQAGDFGFSDSDGNGFLAVALTSLPSVGTLALNGAAVQTGQTISFADIGKLVWTPPKDASGASLGTLFFTVIDDGGTIGGGKDTDPDANAIVFNVGAVTDTITGTPGNDRLTGTDDADIILGLAGKDRLDGRGGADRMEGGAGDDTYVVDDAGDRVIEKAREGTDTIISSVGMTLATLPNVENITLSGTRAINATGNTAANLLTGNDAANVLTGGRGADTLIGKGGKDTLAGGIGNDILTAGAGVDRFVFARNDDRDILTDFAARGAGHDILDLRALSSIASFSDLKTNHMSVSGRDVVIDGWNGDVLTMKNVRLADLDAGDFLI